MSKSKAPVEKPRVLFLKLEQIKVPDVRVRASWDNEMLAMFKDSIKAMGIIEPIVVIKEGQEYWLVDGAHRLEEAQLQNVAKVQAVTMPGTMQDVHLQNLALNRLRGKTKASEMAMVVKELSDRFDVDLDTIAKRTGLKRDYVEKMLVVSRVHPEVLAALDAERIPVGMAFEIGRVPDLAVQERLLIQAKTYEKLTVLDMRDIVDETIRIMNAGVGSNPTPPLATIPESTIKCHFCEKDREMKQIRGFNVCQHCFAIGYAAVQATLREQAEREEARSKASPQSEKQATEPPGGP